MKNISVLIGWILLCFLAGLIGSIFTMPSIPTWYAGLVKPSFNPPNWVFGPAWTTLYILMGISAYLVWKKGWANKLVRDALAIFILQLAVNCLWSVIFFGARDIGFALVEIIMLWLLILGTIIEFYPVSKLAAFLMVPYILWVSFASVLNFSVWMLNR